MIEYMKMLKIIIVLLCMVCGVSFFVSCEDDDTFSSSYANVLTFDVDTLSLDTIFSKVPSAYKLFKVRNHSGSGIRISQVRQEFGARQSGFRVNVHGSFIDPDRNNRVNDLEIRNGDSLRIWVEMTSPSMNDSDVPQLKEDNLIFLLESGREHKVNLRVWTWDADTLSNHIITGDYTIDNADGKPLVVYGPLIVDTTATLNIAAGSTIYFNQNAGIDVRGRLNISGTGEKNVTLRCDRLDSLLNLKYDNIPGKWNGIRIADVSYDNNISYMDLHGASYGIMCDSASTVEREKLSMDHSTIHNISGPGISAMASSIRVENSQISNCLGNCIDMCGGKLWMNSSTVAQFYAYTTGRKYAFNCRESYNGEMMPVDVKVCNSFITGYSDDEVWYSPFKADSIGNIRFDHCLLRTVEPGEKEKEIFTDCIFENLEDTINGKQAFVKFDTKQFEYDFTPKADSPAIGAADATTSAKDDRRANPRKETPDIGCFETYYTKEQ